MHLNRFLSVLFLTLVVFRCSNPTVFIEETALIPIPESIEIKDSYFKINSNTGVRYDNSIFKISGPFLKTFIKEGSGIDLMEGNDIVFYHKPQLTHESYELDIAPSKISIWASSDQGAFYAIQTLRQLLPVALENGTYDKTDLFLKCQTIADAPQFEYRGMHLDVGRHMYSVDFIKKYIDALALLKMNTFHWHLTEDQGWRIEIKKYPKLQEVAAYRKETLVGHYNDQPHRFGGERYGGYYTQNEISDIVAYAQERFVTIIPEIEMPGHSQAAIAAYPQLGCTGNNVEVATKWGVFEEIYCPKESTFQFLEDVIDEVIALFPGKYIHIGGDEAPKARWKNCSHCQQLIQEKDLKDEHGLQSYFIARMERYINSKGKQIIGWDEILEGGLAPNATVMSWRGTEGAVAAARQHHNVVMTPTSHCYFDYYQSENEDEPLAIGGFLPLEKVYQFNPIPEELTEEERKYVLGAQGNVWTEYMPTESQVEYMAFPRMLAMSEVLWLDTDKKNYKDFVNRVEGFHSRLDALDINYANHLYEIEGDMKIENGEAFYELKTQTEGKSIRYTLDGSEPNPNSVLYSGRIPITKNAVVKAAVFKDGEQHGGVFSQRINFHKAVGASISIDKKPHKAYQGSGAQGLINGISGSDKRFGDKEWLGFWGEDIQITIDFEEGQPINSITTRFHNGNGQWIYAPKEVSYEFLLEDGSYVSDKSNLNPIDETHVKLHYDFNTLETMGANVKSIVLKIPNYGTIPEGKQGAGNKAWTFIDEIIVN